MKNQNHSQIANHISVNDQQQETLLIKDLISRFEKVRNQNDAEGYAALFTQDAVLVTPGGVRTVVVVKEQEKWMIAAVHGTIIAEAVKN